MAPADPQVAPRGARPGGQLDAVPPDVHPEPTGPTGILKDWPQARLHVVTGKGGTGKTTVAAALALSLAAGGRRALLVEVEGRQGIARLFDVPPLPYEERRVAVAAGGGELLALAVDPKAALLEYLELFYRLGRAGRVLERLGAVDFATTIAPGVRDVLLTGKVYEAVRRRESGRRGGRTPGAGDRPVYDAVVLDAPPTGRITRFLNVNEEVVGLARVGPIRSQAASIMTLLRSSQTVVHLVTVLEEMPVQESVDAVAELRAAGLPVGGVVVNQVKTPFLTSGQLPAARNGGLDRKQVLAGLSAGGLGRRSRRSGNDTSPKALADALLAEASEHSLRLGVEHQERLEIARLERPTYLLPFVPNGIDLGALYLLANRLGTRGGG